LAIARSPVELNATERGLLPVANGDPDTSFSAPDEEFTENTDVVLAVLLAVARKTFPDMDGLNATEAGVKPVANGDPGISASAPVVVFTANTDTVLAAALAAARKTFPDMDGLNATDSGPEPAVNGDPDTGVSPPVERFTENTETVSSPEFATARKRFPDTTGLNATEFGNAPVANGDPDTWASAPVEPSTEKVDTVFAESLATAMKAPDGLNATEIGNAPVPNGDPDTCTSAPVEESTENIDTLLTPALELVKNPPDGLKAIPSGVEPVTNGDPKTGEKAAPAGGSPAARARNGATSTAEATRTETSARTAGTDPDTGRDGLRIVHTLRSAARNRLLTRPPSPGCASLILMVLDTISSASRTRS
jgi:hypothetical protein